MRVTKYNKLMLGLLAALMVMVVIPVSAHAQQDTETQVVSRTSPLPPGSDYNVGFAELGKWKHTGKGWTAYDKSGRLIKNKWVTEDKGYFTYRYLIGKDGIMVTGWFDSPDITNGSSMYFDKDGQVATTWEKIDGKWYFFNWGGAHLVNGWVNHPASQWYYVKGSGNRGTMITGWEKIGSKWYYFETDGHMLSSKWIYFQGYWYYLKRNGAMALSEWVNYQNEWYYFDSVGTMLHSRTINLNGYSYTLDKDGRWI